MSRVIPESQKTFQSVLENRNHNSLFLLPTTVEELFDIVHYLKNKKIPGCDYITNELITNVIVGIIQPLEHQ